MSTSLPTFSLATQKRLPHQAGQPTPRRFPRARIRLSHRPVPLCPPTGRAAATDLMMAAQLQQAAAGGGPPAELGGGDDDKAQNVETPTTASSLRNRAGDSRSPYVRSLVDSLVKWQLLDDEAVGRAVRENKLIFLHIGFLACHCKCDRMPGKLQGKLHT